MARSLSQTLLAFVLALSCALTPNVVVAQQNEPEQTTAVAGQNEPEQTAESTHGEIYDAYFMSEEHREEIYRKNRKSPTKAVLWTALFPGLGNIYAEQYLFAGVAIIFMVFAGTFVGYGLSTRQPRIIVLGGITAGIAYGGGAFTSLIGVARFNDELRRGLKVGDNDLRETWGPMLTLRF